MFYVMGFEVLSNHFISVQPPRRKSRLASTQKMVLNTVNFQGSQESKWSGQIRHGLNSTGQVSKISSNF